MNKTKQLSVFLTIVALSSSAQEWKLDSAGVRVGTSINNRSDTFRQVEGTLNLRLPWQWDLGSGWQLGTRLDFSGGWLHGEGENAVIGTLGPSAILSWKDFPVSLDVGSSPTLISRHHFGNRDFGGAFQFTTHAGLNWDLARHVSVGYRYQHMSNAGLFDSNPGLNLHLLSVSYRF
ncbi:MAG TPA: acyloxyacyl hydrolase [Verrucomicrobiae bacterium]|nr:acyloxyacyl hydrolase [Verrucomicrobiae bacterium]